jgi:hypothetical protein
MAEQLMKRTSQEWVKYVLEKFNDRTFSEKYTCQLLEIKRSQLYELRKRWLRAQIGKKHFRLNSSGQNQKHSLSQDIQDFLYQELSYIKKEANHYRGKFNFASNSYRTVLETTSSSLHRGHCN